MADGPTPRHRTAPGAPCPSRAPRTSRAPRSPRALRGVAAGALTVALLGLAPQAHAAGTDAPAVPAPPSAATLKAAHAAADDGSTVRTLARFFARGGRHSASAAQPKLLGTTVPVRTLSAGFVAARGAKVERTPVAGTEAYATTAVAADGRRASVSTARTAHGWRVVNIATGDDETRYAAKGAKKAPGGTVFHEPQIDAWYVQEGTRILPLDRDARAAVGPEGTDLRTYHARVHREYADKLPGSAYDRKGLAGGFGPQSHGSGDNGDGASGSARAGVGARADEGRARAADARPVAADGSAASPVTAVATTAGVCGALLAAAAGGTWLIRRRTGTPRR